MRNICLHSKLACALALKSNLLLGTSKTVYNTMFQKIVNLIKSQYGSATKKNTGKT